MNDQQARERFQALLREAEGLQAPDPATDPLEDFRKAEEWGVPSWVHCMVQVDIALAQLRALAVTDPQEKTARARFLEVAVGSLNALVLYEQGAKGLDAKTLDWVVATYHDEIVARIMEGEEELAKTEHFGHLHLDTITDKEPEEDQPSRPEEDRPGDDTGPWSIENEPADPSAVVEEVPADRAGHDFRPEDDPPPDLDKAERGLVRQVAALRQTAAGSSAVELGGMHASPADTDPSMEEKTGRH